MPSGIILLDKPQGLSSNGALQRVRKAYRAASAGHVGTLDPMATGMLPLCLDEATKVIAEIESGAKCYEFTVQLGARTDTGDAEGRSGRGAAGSAARHGAHRVGTDWLSRHAPAGAAHVFGAETRRPSAVRAGAPGHRSGARRTHHRNPPTGAGRVRRQTPFDLICECAKGTYIRVLGEDIARALGTCGHLTQLRRAWVEPFRDCPMVELDAVLDGAASGEHLQAPDVALQALPQTRVTAAQVATLRHGQALEAGAASIDGRLPGRRVRVYGPEGAFLGLAELLAGWPAAAAASHGWQMQRKPRLCRTFSVVFAPENPGNKFVLKDQI